jgi:GNAT superfamily N-acetyltransferase
MSSPRDLQFSPVFLADQSKLYSLMEKIYLPAYSSIWKDGGKWFLERNYSVQNLKKELQDHRARYFFVLNEGQEIGIVRYLIPSSSRIYPIPAATKLHRLYLHEDFQGKGIASQIIKMVEKDSQNKGIHTVWLEVMEFKKQAKRFYEKSGFELETTYQIDFEQMLPEYRWIEIRKKILSQNPSLDHSNL